MRVKLTVEYAGEGFHGWQSQSGQVTVQGSLESALEIYLKGESKKVGRDAPERVVVQGSGRTDAGVHARGQVASFLWPEGYEFSVTRIKEALNALTPQALTVKSIEQVDDSFDARHSPHIKCYSYRITYRGAEDKAARFASIDAGRSWVVTRPLNIRSMILGARVLEGQHDFQSFRAVDCGAATTIRTVVRSEIVRLSDSELIYCIHGKGFLKQMVRIVIGTLVELGQSQANSSTSDGADYMRGILNCKERAKAGKTAPAEGLCLEWVRYEGNGLI